MLLAECAIAGGRAVQCRVQAVKKNGASLARISAQWNAIRSSSRPGLLSYASWVLRFRYRCEQFGLAQRDAPRPGSLTFVEDEHSPS